MFEGMNYHSYCAVCGETIQAGRTGWVKVTMHMQHISSATGQLQDALR